MPGIAMEDIAHFDGVTRFDLLNVGFVNYRYASLH